MWQPVRSSGKEKPYIPSAHLFVMLNVEFRLKKATNSCVLAASSNPLLVLKRVGMPCYAAALCGDAQPTDEELYMSMVIQRAKSA